MPNILLLDIETSPNLAYCWGIWKENIGVDQLKSTSEMICWAAKWYGKPDKFYRSVYHDKKSKMLNELHSLLNESDIVVHFNGRAFDIPTINKDFILNKMNPPSPYRQVDLMEVAKSVFRFQSNKLEFICRQLGIGDKHKHEGFGLWKKCLENDSDAWETMKKYNIKDVVLTEQLYERLLPWIRNHPSLAVIAGKNGSCPNCLSENIHKKGLRLAISKMHQEYQCQKCGKYFSREVHK